MALNSFFLHGSSSEQRLIQSLINEQLSMYGMEVAYIPQRIIRKETIMEEVSSSQFTDKFMIEAYLSNYDGYSGSGDILTKFGMQLKDEVTLIISKEKFEDFISPFLSNIPAAQNTTSLRPREGDLIWFPLGERLFEIKFVEHEQPFYQLGKTYVYELQCELFEYSDRSIIDTSISDIDQSLQEYGYIKSLTLFGSGSYASAQTTLNDEVGYVKKLNLIDDGYNYTTVPNVIIDSPPDGGVTATAVAITSCTGNFCSVRELYLTNAGAGYIVIPNVIISGTTGVGATAVAEIDTDSNGIKEIIINDGGSGYNKSPVVTFRADIEDFPGTVPTGIVNVSAAGTVTSVYISHAGIGFTVPEYSAPIVEFAASATITGIGTYIFNEVVTGETSNTTARVKNWNVSTKVLQIANIAGTFLDGEVVVGSASSARYTISDLGENPSSEDKYDQNDEIQTESTSIIDFTEKNLFGNY